MISPKAELLKLFMNNIMINNLKKSMIFNEKGAKYLSLSRDIPIN